MGLEGTSVPCAIAICTGEKKIICSKLARNVDRPWMGQLGPFSKLQMKDKLHKHKMSYFIMHSEQLFLLGVLRLTLGLKAILLWREAEMWSMSLCSKGLLRYWTRYIEDMPHTLQRVLCFL